MKRFTSLFLITLFFFSCKDTPEQIKKENILDSLFAKFENIETISYTNRFVYAETTDTATSYLYFEKFPDSTGYMLSYNHFTYILNGLHFLDIYNASENKLYFHSKYATSITDYNNFVKDFPEMGTMSHSLLTFVKYLRQTLTDHPETVKVKDTIINSKELFLIEYSNPDGLPFKGMPSVLLNDTTLPPLRLILDKSTALPHYQTWGYMIFKISDIVFNPNTHDSIWSENNMPDFFRNNLQEFVETEPDFVLAAGTSLPTWGFQTLQNKKYQFEKLKKHHLIVFFSMNCRACAEEIKTLNKLSENKNIHITGVCFEEDYSKLPNFIKKHNIKYEIVKNNDKALKEEFECGGFPVNYLVDKNGIIIYSVLGNIPKLEEEILKRIK